MINPPLPGTMCPKTRGGGGGRFPSDHRQAYPPLTRGLGGLACPRAEGTSLGAGSPHLPARFARSLAMSSGSSLMLNPPCCPLSSLLAPVALPFMDRLVVSTSGIYWERPQSPFPPVFPLASHEQKAQEAFYARRKALIERQINDPRYRESSPARAHAHAFYALLEPIGKLLTTRPFARASFIVWLPSAPHSLLVAL